jgi:transcriptional regulator with XRE-family HTH domain
MIEEMPRSYSSWAVPGLRQARRQRMLTQMALATRSSVNVATIIRLEAGGTALAATIRKLARALRVSTEALMAEPEPEPEDQDA